jgi:dienelactone hydrolase
MKKIHPLTSVIATQNSFGGDVLPADVILAGPEHWGSLDFPTFFGSKNAKHVRGPEMVECAQILRARYKHLGAVGYCFGGWGVFQLGSTANKGLVDCISTAHPAFLVEGEIRGLGVPVQICAPQNDSMFPEDLKALCNQVIPTLGIPYDYQHFPGLDHGFAIRGDVRKPAEREGMERAKNAVVAWCRQWLHER